MSLTAEQLQQSIERSQLLTPADLSTIRSGWFQDRRQDAADVQKFGRWLVLNHYFSEFGLRLVRDGKADLLRCNQYRIVSPIAKGPFAGGYLALDPLRRKVVVEVLAAPCAADPATLQAFQGCAGKALAVHHANVNRCLDVGTAQGRHYLVSEYEEGETLADILGRRGKLAPAPAARLFALALAGLQALHDKAVPAGALGPDSLLLTATGTTPHSGAKQRTLKLIHVGVPPRLFDPAALGGAAGNVAAGPGGSDWGTARPADELLLLGATFYQSLTGQRPQAPVVPVRELNPEVPEMLAEVVEHLIEADPAKRPRSAGHAAKTLRVFIASEEEPRELRTEDHLALPLQSPSPPAPLAAPEPPGGQPAETAGVHGKFAALWAELRPNQRDLLFLGTGAAAVVLLGLLLMLITGISFVNIVCLVTGGALSFFVERWLRLREQEEPEPEPVVHEEAASTE